MSIEQVQAFLDELTILSHKHQIVIGQYPDNIASPPILEQMGGYVQGIGRYIMLVGHLQWHNSHWPTAEEYLTWCRTLNKEEQQ